MSSGLDFCIHFASVEKLLCSQKRSRHDLEISAAVPPENALDLR